MNWIKLIIFNLIITLLLSELILRFIYTPEILDIRISMKIKPAEIMMVSGYGLKLQVLINLIK